MKYVTGLVVGKFCPLHKGHEYLIKSALEQCEKVIVISYTSESYTGCDAAEREKWIRAIECEQFRLEVYVLDGLVRIKDTAPDRAHREFCANYLLNTLDTTVQAVFSSESYGDGFANFLTDYFSTSFINPIKVDHVLVDIERNTCPISGSFLRKSIKEGEYSYANKFLSPIVAASFVRKILFLGGESTGKSTLVTDLFKHFRSAMAPEYGRTHYGYRNHKLVYEDMAYIAKSQLAIENDRASRLKINQYLFCDTSVLTTRFYSQEWFGRVALQLSDLVWDCEHRYHKVYVCAPDFPLVQDGTRQDETFRNKGHQYYIEYLTVCEPGYTLLTGSREERLAKVIADLSL